MLLQFRALGVTMSSEEAHPGARASRPHKSSRSFSHLLHRNQPATAPCLCFGRAHAVPAHRVAACSIALKLSGGQSAGCGRDARAPRRCRPGRAVGGVWRATSQKADVHPLGNSRMPASRAPAPGPGGSFEGETGFVSDKSGPRPPRRGGSFESETGFVSDKARGLMDLLQRQLAPKCFCTFVPLV